MLVGQVYSLGLVAYFCLSLRYFIQQKPFEMQWDDVQVSERFKQVIREMLQVSAEQRITVEALCDLDLDSVVGENSLSLIT